MTPSRFLPALFALPAVLLASSMAHAVAAPLGCGTGPACAAGFECTVVGASGCAGAAPCAPGESCPDPKPCDTTEEYGCTPAHCQTDADCGGDMLCHEWTEGCVTTGCACAPGESCDCAEPEPCEPTKVSMCTPRYLLPCEAAADCGPGFTCDAVTSCSCSGSGGGATPPSPEKIPAPSAGGAPPQDDPAPIPSDCSCEPSGQKQCVAQDIACQSDAECPASWLCEPQPTAVPNCTGGDCGALPAPSPEKLCRPPYYGGGDVGDPETPVRGDDGSGTGTPTTGTPSPGTPNKGSESSADSQESSACQFGPASTRGGALGLLSVLGALFGLSRRRRSI